MKDRVTKQVDKSGIDFIYSRSHSSSKSGIVSSLEYVGSTFCICLVLWSTRFLINPKRSNALLKQLIMMFLTFKYAPISSFSSLVVLFIKSLLYALIVLVFYLRSNLCILPLYDTFESGGQSKVMYKCRCNCENFTDYQEYDSR